MTVDKALCIWLTVLPILYFVGLLIVVFTQGKVNKAQAKVNDSSFDHVQSVKALFDMQHETLTRRIEALEEKVSPCKN